MAPCSILREMEVGSACQDFRDPDVRFVGGGVDTLGILVSALHGGQVVLDAPAWEAVHEVLPLQCQALDLGVHYVWPPSGCDVPSQALEPMHLMEVWVAAADSVSVCAVFASLKEYCFFLLFSCCFLCFFPPTCNITQPRCTS